MNSSESGRIRYMPLEWLRKKKMGRKWMGIEEEGMERHGKEKNCIRIELRGVSRERQREGDDGMS